MTATKTPILLTQLPPIRASHSSLVRCAGATAGCTGGGNASRIGAAGGGAVRGSGGGTGVCMGGGNGSRIGAAGGGAVRGSAGAGRGTNSRRGAGGKAV